MSNRDQGFMGLGQGLASCTGRRAISAGVEMFMTFPSPEKPEAPSESVAGLAAWALCTLSMSELPGPVAESAALLRCKRGSRPIIWMVAVLRLP